MLPGGVAVIEMAAAAGLPLVGERRSAEQTTTYGVGQLMRLALERGCKKIIMGLGGSATNDGGCGDVYKRQGAWSVPSSSTRKP